MKPIKNTMGMFDMTKGLFVIAMLFSHASQNYTMFWDADMSRSALGMVVYILYKLLSCCVIPMFCIICGYGFRKKTMGKCIKGQVKFIWKPYVLMALAVSVGVVAKKLLIHGSIREGLRFQALPYLLGTCPRGEYFGIEMDSIGPVWFIVAYVLGGIFLNMVLQEERLWGQLLLVTSMAAIGVVLKDYRIPFCFQQSLIFALYMYIGWLMKKKKFLETPIPAAWWAIGGAFLAFSAYFGEIEASQNVWRNGLADVLAGVFGGVMLLVLLLQLNGCKGKIATSIRWLGRQVMPICCIHSVFYTLLPRQKVAQYFTGRAALGITLELLLYFTTAIVGCWLIQKWKKLKSTLKTNKEE